LSHRFGTGFGRIRLVIARLVVAVISADGVGVGFAQLVQHVQTSELIEGGRLAHQLLLWLILKIQVGQKRVVRVRIREFVEKMLCKRGCRRR